MTALNVAPPNASRWGHVLVPAAVSRAVELYLAPLPMARLDRRRGTRPLLAGNP
jgi:hypothetical protein